METKETMERKLEATVINLCDSLNEKVGHRGYKDLTDMVKAIAELTTAIARLKD